VKKRQAVDKPAMTLFFYFTKKVQIKHRVENKSCFENCFQIQCFEFPANEFPLGTDF